MSTSPASLFQTLALRERYRDDYWARRDPIAEDRLLWRAQTFRHTVHCLPGQRILELGAGNGLFTRQLARATRGESPITSVTFRTAEAGRPLAGVERLHAAELPGPLAGRRFDFVVGMDLLDRRDSARLLALVHELLEPGGQLVFYESNPWNPVLKLRAACARALGRPDPRDLLDRTRLYELLSEIGFIRVFAVFNDFVFAPLTRAQVWLLRNLSILLENAPLARTLAGSILLHAQKPPRLAAAPAVSLFRHEALRRAVSVVIPCHDEETNVAPLVERLLALYGEYVREIVLVDDDSRDGTRAAIEVLARREPRVRGVFRSPPKGVGRALADGLRVTSGKWVLTSDCDFQHLLPEFRDLFDAAAEGWDVVVGSRFSRHSVLLNYPFAKIFANRAFHALARLLFWRRFRDVTNNLKLMRREVVDDLVLREPGFAVNAEIGLEPLLSGYRMCEVPISWINRTPGMGTSSFRLAQVGSGYWRVLVGLWLRCAFGAGPYRRLVRHEPVRSPQREDALHREAPGETRP
jgi:SAM-dependent methyltransferase